MSTLERQAKHVSFLFLSLSLTPRFPLSRARALSPACFFSVRVSFHLSSFVKNKTLTKTLSVPTCEEKASERARGRQWPDESTSISRSSPINAELIRRIAINELAAAEFNARLDRPVSMSLSSECDAYGVKRFSLVLARPISSSCCFHSKPTLRLDVHQIHCSSNTIYAR